MDTKKLRQKILDLAIRGKLVPQDPNDEPASVLLERIRAEKERLIKEGKIKRGKKSASDTPHYENEAPFEVPKGWEWLHVESFTYDLQYGTSEKSSNEGDVPVLRMGNITRIGTIDFADLVYSSNKDDISKYALQKDDLLFNRTNSSEWVGKTAIFKSDSPAIYAGYLIRVRCILVCPDYINFVLNSSYHRDWCNSVKTDAVNQSNINAQKLSKHLIPIPPYEEQLRIVAETKIWMNVIDKLEGDVSEFEQVISKIKSKILDLAIHGKLVPQDLNDEPAIEFLKRINPKFTPCDNAHYENLPKGWTEINVGELAQYTNGKAFQPSDWEQRGLPIIRIQNLNDENCKYNYTSIGHEEKYRITNGDLLFAWAASLGVYIWQGNDAWLNQHIFKVEPLPFIDKQFLYYLFQYLISEFYTRSHGSGMVHITKKEFETTTALLPPLSEQRRIVKSIESYYTALDNIRANL